MGAPGTKSIRNVVLVGHGSAGKTSLAEAMLFVSKATTRLGDVDAGQSNLDYDPEEIKRKYTINVALAPINHKDHKINLIDTPGYADFIGGAVAGMEAAEMALFVIDAVSGPQVITDRLWKAAGEKGISRAFFINKLDKEHAQFNHIIAKLKDRYGERIVPVQIPIGREDEFSGVVDIITMTAKRVVDGKEVVVDIPEDLVEICKEARESLLDRTAEADDELLMKYLEGEEMTQDDLEKLLHLAINLKKIVPVFVGSSKKLHGISNLMDEIVSYFPRPMAHGAVPTVDGGEVKFDAEGEIAARVFETQSDPYVGRLSFIKVVSGNIKPGTDLINARSGKKERITHIFKMTGKETEPMTQAVAGDIFVAPKLMETTTNDTLSVKGDIEFFPMKTPQPLYPVAIIAATKADEDKLGTALRTMTDETPSLELVRNEETRQTVINARGEAAIEVLRSRLRERFNVETELLPLRIAYRETATKVASAQGRHKKQSGGSGQFGDCWLRIEPNTGGGYEFLDEIVGGRIPRQFIPAVDRGIQETMEGGVIAGYPVVDVKVAAYDGSYHSVDSNEMAFRTAARIGFKAAFEQAGPVILEPMAHMEVTVPEEYAGAIMSDMANIRGRVEGMDMTELGDQTIRIIAPYAEIVHYSPHLRSLSHGSGTYTYKLEGYEQVPPMTQKKIIEEYEAARSGE